MVRAFPKITKKVIPKKNIVKGSSELERKISVALHKKIKEQWPDISIGDSLRLYKKVNKTFPRDKILSFIESKNFDLKKFFNKKLVNRSKLLDKKISIALHKKIKEQWPDISIGDSLRLYKKVNKTFPRDKILSVLESKSFNLKKFFKNKVVVDGSILLERRISSALRKKIKEQWPNISISDSIKLYRKINNYFTKDKVISIIESKNFDIKKFFKNKQPLIKK